MSGDNQKENQEKIEKFWLKNLWKVFSIETFLFSFSLFLGILSALKTTEILQAEKINIEKISFWHFIVFFLFATIFFLFFVYFFKPKKTKKIIYKITFLFTTFLAGLFCLESFFKEPLALIIMFFLVSWWLKRPILLNHNILMVLAIAGTGSALGLAMDPLLVLILLIIFSLYDFIAVYKTKHMVKMATDMIENQAILGIILPFNLSQFNTHLKEVKVGSGFIVLGAGDIVFPLLFAVSLLSSSFLEVIMVVLFSFFGLFLGFYIFISQKTRKPFPALPPIAFFSIIAFLLARIFSYFWKTFI